MNSFGEIFRLTTFGESHGPAIGGIVDGMPAGLPIAIDEIPPARARRRPGPSELTTSRREADTVEILSGIFEGVTTGTPIGFTIRNTDQHSSDYDTLRHTFRPSHADYTYHIKYASHRDHRGGGRSSARETAVRVAAGAIAMQALRRLGIEIFAYASAIGEESLPLSHTEITPEQIDTNPVRCPDPATAERMAALIRAARSEGDTLGGIVTCVVRGCPAGLGSPIYGKLQAQLASAMMSINAAKGFDYGMGFDGCRLRGSETIDPFTVDPATGSIHTTSNHSGGIQGGISNGEEIYFRVGFKPVATLLRDVPTVTDSGDPATLHARGRHDPCVVPRAVPVVEAMAAMVILDNILQRRTDTLC
ncbi:MAG: chorismate synthase [Paramuribaculum sp.]|nr:chorismate synthase [Paramuribaculum sp.]